MQCGWGMEKMGVSKNCNWQQRTSNAGSRAVIEGNRQEKQTKNDPPGMDQK